MNKSILVSLIAVVIAILAFVGAWQVKLDQAKPSLGGVTNYDEVDVSALKVGGANGTRIGLMAAGTCALIAGNYTVAASTTVAMDCAVTGVASGDYVLGQFASSTPANQLGWAIVGAQASSTANFITLSVANLTGASAVIPARLASSTQYLVLHPRSGVPGL